MNFYVGCLPSNADRNTGHEIVPYNPDGLVLEVLKRYLTTEPELEGAGLHVSVSASLLGVVRQ
jgi:hypothetical protein